MTLNKAFCLAIILSLSIVLAGCKILGPLGLGSGPVVDVGGGPGDKGPPTDETRVLKVLAIGNSFSQDALQHLYHIAADAGAETIVLGNLYIGGASLDLHANNARTGSPAYRYDKNVSGNWTSRNSTTMLHGLQDERWDVITLQQASGYSGVGASYTDGQVLHYLIQYVNENKTNPDARLAWHMTWAYEANSTHQAFATYDRDQQTMYDAIVQAVQQHIVPNDAFDLIIPAGTAIQNVRTSYIGDTLTRDGYHLSLSLGRYIAGLTWLHAVTGWPVDDISYVPSTADVPQATLNIVKEAVQAAVRDPFNVTESTAVTEPDINYADYTLLDWNPVGCAYWNSRNTAGLAATLISKQNSNASNLCYFVSSGRMFTRDDLPVGSVIEIENGYVYRPEAWVDLGLQAAARPAVVSTPRVIVTDEWWGNYTYRAFNVSFAGSTTNVSEIVEETAAKFKVYIPIK